ncbi:hypothetical protein BGW80DRAFT_394308 [Lactifluus volemus]|nr:hypothetical protein BGW80DRAFT_394308 [Lactifluus volemus]
MFCVDTFDSTPPIDEGLQWCRFYSNVPANHWIGVLEMAEINHGVHRIDRRCIFVVVRILQRSDTTGLHASRTSVSIRHSPLLPVPVMRPENRQHDSTRSALGGYPSGTRMSAK